MRKLYFIAFVSTVLTWTFMSSCEKEITVDLPTVESKIVVEGNIQQGQPPIVMLTWSQGYFEPADLSSLDDLFVRNANVTMSDGVTEFVLDEICSSDLPEEFLPQISEATGFTIDQLQSLNICAYTSLDPAAVGQVNRTYDLSIDFESHALKASTKINNLVYLDSVWFETAGNSDSLGFAFARLTDPDTLGNAYRWFAKRINKYPSWADRAGEQKDFNYIAPLGSANDDEFFNGLSFVFGFFRGSDMNSTKEDDLNEERGFYKVGDTIAVRGTVIDYAVFRFVSTFEDQQANQGTPFAIPANLESNIEGGLGLWAGYGATFDTIICTP